MKNQHWLYFLICIFIFGVLFSGCSNGNGGTGEVPNTTDPTMQLAGKLLILQAYGSSGNADGVSHSFVELYNVSNAPINLNGITLYYADGTSVSADHLPNNHTHDGSWKAIRLNGIIQPQTSFLVLGPRQNTTGRLQITDNSGDINNANFILSSRAFKVALIHGAEILTDQNPFDTDGKGTPTAGYIDMLGTANEYSIDGSERDRIFGFETAPALNSASFAARRKNLIDTDDNSTDFIAIDYREWTEDHTDRVTDEQLDVFRPKNLAFKAWNPFVEFLPYVEGTRRLLIFQANSHGNDNGISDGAPTGGGFSRPLIELYNNTHLPIDLEADDYYLHIGNDSGWLYIIKLTGTVPPQCSYLIVSDQEPKSSGNDGNFNSTPRAILPSPDQTYPFDFTHNNFKVVLMTNQSEPLTVNNPSEEESLKRYYIDMLGAGTTAFEGANNAMVSHPQPPRRVSLTDTGNNRADFQQVDYRGRVGTHGINDDQLYKFWPRNSTMGKWNPITGLPVIDPVIPVLVSKNVLFPIIYIDTRDRQKITHDKEYVGMNIKIVSKDTHHCLEHIGFEDGIRGRGNSTWEYPKKPYRIKFNHSTSLFGLEKAKSWVLLAEYRSPTLLQNVIAFELGRRLELPFVNHYQYVELVLNGEHQGIYIVTEQIQVHKGRVDIDEKEGFLVQLDFYFDSEPKFETSKFSLPVMIESPEDLADESGYNFVKEAVNNLTEKLSEASFPNNGYDQLIDMNNFVDYLMIYDILMNFELQVPASIYMYKNVGEKIKMGPIWDFDCGYGYEDDTFTFFRECTGRAPNFYRREGWGAQAFFQQFFKDPVFIKRYKNRWNEKYSEFIDIMNFIDTMYAKLKPALELNSAVWKTADPEIEIERLKAWWGDRITWLGESINSQ